ncbi:MULTISPECIES: hypothetical protein [unclassified Microbacterium]|uniref:hypothetical protein n=1 Tax=unclassified Microbacterium TaxID=2609290 RepID=UPI00288304D9|nr:MULTISPECIES: hypothetical protein [unclassified Microbacterium]
MANPTNNGSITGRVAQDIQSFTNRDGSKSLLITIAARDNFLSGTGEDRKAASQFIDLRAFVPSNVEGNGSWDRVGNGDLISVNYSLSRRPYTDKDGETVFPPVTVEVDGYPVFLESSKVTQERAARKAVAAEAPAPESTLSETDAQELARLRAQQEQLAAEATTPFAGVPAAA